MKRLTLFLILVLTLIGSILTVSSAIAVDEPRARGMNESAFARTCKQPAG